MGVFVRVAYLLTSCASEYEALCSCSFHGIEAENTEMMEVEDSESHMEDF